MNKIGFVLLDIFFNTFPGKQAEHHKKEFQKEPDICKPVAYWTCAHVAQWLDTVQFGPNNLSTLANLVKKDPPHQTYHKLVVDGGLTGKMLVEYSREKLRNFLVAIGFDNGGAIECTCDAVEELKTKGTLTQIL